jgi:DNA-binding HxlR family transcriptional regulator
MLHVLYALATGKGGLRFSEIKKSALTDSTTLTRRLAELEEIGIILRVDLSTSQRNVEYQFTELFDLLKPILDGLLHYGLEGTNSQ